MPRANPSRSDYCASRHLLRSLNDPAELRRNPLVRPYFTAPADTPAVVQRIHGLVHVALLRCRERKGVRAHATLARMHAALLRCDIDKQPLSVVGAELGLSARQIRRERRAAHDAFIAVFRAEAAEWSPAAVRDTARFRLARASELHELGQSPLALAACDAIAAHAPIPDRIDALCLASEIERDGGRADAAAACVDRAAALLQRYGDDMTPAMRTLGEERADFAAWRLRRDDGMGCALTLEPPAVVRRSDACDPSDQPRLALAIRALAAYADQRWEVGDALRAVAAIDRAWLALRLLRHRHAKETLAVMMADARAAGLVARDDLPGFAAVERLAQSRGYVRTLALARAERIGTMVTRGCEHDDVFGFAIDGLDLTERSAPWTVGAVAFCAMQSDRRLRRRLQLADMMLRVLPARSGLRLLARVHRARVAFDAGRYEVARTLAHHVSSDAQLCGNARVRGGAEHCLAAVAIMQHRRREAVRHLDVALPVLQRYGMPLTRHDAMMLARRLDAGANRPYLSANIATRMSA